MTCCDRTHAELEKTRGEFVDLLAACRTQIGWGDIMREWDRRQKERAALYAKWKAQAEPINWQIAICP